MNKIIILTAATLLIANLCKAQTEKGNQTVGLTINYFNQTAKQTNYDYTGNVAIQGSSKEHGFNIAPTYSYFIANKLDIGFAAAYGNTVVNNTYTPVQQYATDQQKDKTYSATIYLRKYFLYDNKIGLRAGPYLNYYHDDSKLNFPAENAQSDVNTKTESVSGGLTMDFVYYPSKRIGLAATLANLSYGHYTQNSVLQTGSGNNLNFALVNNGLSLSIFYTFY